MTTSTPYYPLGVDIIGYVPNTQSTAQILLSFSASVAAVLFIALLTARRLKLSRYETLSVLWFLVSGCIHFVLEGFYAHNFAILASSSHPIAQAWKEYSLSDSRYLTSDPFMIVMESITAFLWGPICFTLVVFIIIDHPLRLPLQIIVCVGQIYGNVLYYGIVFLMDILYDVQTCRPETYYFYGYFIFLNAFWIFIPGYYLKQAVAETRDTIHMVQAAMRRHIEERHAAKM
ncbi:hypothetical protein Cpir12675_001385 [Ceratocystis pirilliformis]|uniref:EXPERA domain-containing protein n=1 Tax=Ceratocystis pirilliformis TaxID=259994 RepID=A0ABR3ZFY9_9PEZI